MYKYIIGGFCIGAITQVIGYGYFNENGISVKGIIVNICLVGLYVLLKDEN